MKASSVSEAFTQGLCRVCDQRAGRLLQSVIQKQREQQNHWSVIRFTVVQPQRLENHERIAAGLGRLE